jgi:hypothetical protein
MSTRRRLFALVPTVLAMLAIAVAAEPAHADGFNPINIWNSSHCLDNATENAAKLQMWSCSGGSEQRWSIGFNSTNPGVSTFKNQRTGRCIAAPAWGPGTVTMAFCDEADPSQHWRGVYADNPLGPPSGWFFVFQNVASGYCLATSSVGNGTLPQTVNCDPSEQYERWHEQ